MMTMYLTYTGDRVNIAAIGDKRYFLRSSTTSLLEAPAFATLKGEYENRLYSGDTIINKI